MWMKTIGQMNNRIGPKWDAQLRAVDIYPQESEILAVSGPKGEVARLVPLSHKSHDPFISFYFVHELTRV